MNAKPLVFADFHHSSLLYSLIMLFEGRMNGSLYRPIGLDWHTQGLWRLSDDPGVVNQYLSIEGATPLKLKGTIAGLPYPSVYSYQDEGFAHKAITLEAFYRMPVDIVIASVPEHIEPYRRLCAVHPRKPKLIFQIGNPWTIEDRQVRNVMSSALVRDVPSDIHYIRYHQEFDLTVFHPDFASPGRHIHAFINCFATADQYVSDWKLFEEIERLMPDWTFRSFGGNCRDGDAAGPAEVARCMKKARFVWHTKNGGDGYGHVIYNSAAVARPMIVRMADYEDKQGIELMSDGITCVAIDGLTPGEIARKIVYYSDERRYAALCHNIRDNFKAKVDFDREGKALKKFIKKLR
ncbi:hypothetical protein [Cohnella sp. GCM10027633]|uniref:hypothetical protein n=1 Tax=unclassified Cohnella TaxID=2636738 RepID=UPI00363C9A02